VESGASVKQIRDNIPKRLTGNEEGLTALWNFDDPAQPAKDASPKHRDGKLIGNARVRVLAASEVVSAPTGEKAALASLSGRLTDGAGKPLRGAEVRVMQGELVVGNRQGGRGRRLFSTLPTQPSPVSRPSLSGRIGSSNRRKKSSPRRQTKLDLTLRDTLRISGTLVGARWPTAGVA
jgi:hypothetical protein